MEQYTYYPFKHTKNYITLQVDFLHHTCCKLVSIIKTKIMIFLLQYLLRIQNSQGKVSQIISHFLLCPRNIHTPPIEFFCLNPPSVFFACLYPPCCKFQFSFIIFLWSLNLSPLHSLWEFSVTIPGLGMNFCPETTH